ncbi:MAG: ABC transporter substrate-binding protein [Colwellia sp.]|nr:ABC transporter substrate-binding protein [Colwellia sp.]
MRNKDKIIQILLFLSYCLSYAAIGKNSEIIELTAGYSKPPFVIENIEQYNGIQLDLMTEIFAVENQAVSFIHVPLARSFSSANKWHSDGIITLPSTHKQKSVFISEPYISYQNVVITLAEDNLIIDKLDDLSGKYIIAFQPARKFLGAGYNQAIENAADYQEMADQMKQIELLFIKRTQVLVVDINILKHFLFNHRDPKYNKPYKIHWLFLPRVYAAGFKSKAVRDQFNRGLAVIKANGTYQEVLDKYLL